MPIPTARQEISAVPRFSFMSRKPMTAKLQRIARDRGTAAIRPAIIERLERAMMINTIRMEMTSEEI
jgi:hypothetical protein